MKDILTIIKKELTRFFTDYRMLGAMIIPGILIYVIYSFLGPAINSNMNTSKDYKYQVYVINKDETIISSLEEAFKVAEYNVEILEATDLGLIEDAVANENTDLIIEFNNDTTPISINLYYNSARTESQTIYSFTTGFLNSIQVDPVDYKFTYTPNDLASEEQISSSIISMLLPFLIMIFLCTGVMSVAPESIAGEKDRGTIATLLVTPLKRTDLAVGKIVSLSVISLVGGISSFIGTILSLPKLTNSGSMQLFYSALDYVYLLLIIISVLFFFVGIYSICSAMAKSVKEASAYSTPIMILVMIVAVLSMFGNAPTDNLGIYFIPVYNSAIAMSGVLALDINIAGVVISIVSNIVYSIVFAVILGKMFNSEKVMFNK